VSDRCLIADVIVDAGQRRLWRGDRPLPVTRLTFELLLTLMERSPNLVTHDEIIARVWGPRRIVSSETLAQTVLRLRHSLGDDASAPRYIESIRGNGYRLIPAVLPLDGSGGRPPRESHGTRSVTGQSSGSRSIAGVASLCLLVAVAALGLGRMTGDSSVVASGLPSALRESAVQPRSVAILPVASNGMDAADAVTADGFHSDILSELARIGELTVIARASMRRYADSELPISDIARELNVQTVMKIDLSRSGQRLDLAAELIDGRTGAQRWFGRYEGHLDNIYGLQRELVARIAEELGARLTDGERARLQARPTTSAEAYELFLAAVDAFELDFADHAMIARSFLDKAISLDPNFARAYGLKALIYANGIDDVTGSDEDLMAAHADRARLANQLAAQAIEIDAETVVAHRARAIAAMHSWRWNEARRAFESALEYGPNDVAALAEFAFFRSCALRENGGLALGQRALELDPRNPRMLEMYGRSLNCLGRSEEAFAALRKSVDLDPTSVRRRGQLAYVAARIRPADEAVRELRAIEPMLRDLQLQTLPPVALTYAQLGFPDDARRVIARFEALNGHRTTNLGNSVFANLAVGENEAAYSALEQGVERLGPGSGYLTLLAIRDNLREVPALDEPRFVRLRERIRSLD